MFSQIELGQIYLTPRNVWKWCVIFKGRSYKALQLHGCSLICFFCHGDTQADWGEAHVERNWGVCQQLAPIPQLCQWVSWKLLQAFILLQASRGHQLQQISSSFWATSSQYCPAKLFPYSDPQEILDTINVSLLVLFKPFWFMSDFNLGVFCYTAIDNVSSDLIPRLKKNIPIRNSCIGLIWTRTGFH